MTANKQQDEVIAKVAAQVRAVGDGSGAAPAIKAFFDEATFTVTYVVHDTATRKAAIIDSVWDFQQASGRTCFRSADAIIAHVAAERLEVELIFETHAHADHLSAAPYLQERLGGKLAIGREIVTVQGVFGKIFNEGTDLARDGSQFDLLLDDGSTLMLGSIPIVALHVPGHTPADMAYAIGNAVFVGDTMFMPDYGSARCDFPGGDARTLYRSIQRLLGLPDETRLFLCHDYKAPGRDRFAWETTVGAQRVSNVHVRDGISEDEFVEMRTSRDKTLPMPQLILPSIQVNMRAGHPPEPEENGVRYLKIPLDLL